MEPSNGFEVAYGDKKFVPHWCHGDTFDVDLKVGGGFELKTTSFQKLL